MARGRGVRRADGRDDRRGGATELYKERNTVERCINKIKIWRGLAMRSDKKPESYLAGLQLRGVLIWMRSLKPAT